MAVRSALRAGHTFPPGSFLVSVRGWVNPRTIVWLQGLAKVTKRNSDFFGNRTRDLQACSLVPQLTTLPRATLTVKVKVKVKVMLQLTVSQSWCHVHSGTCDQILFSVWKLLCCLPDERSGLSPISHCQQYLVHCQKFNIIYIVHVTCFMYMQYILDLCQHRLSTADHAKIYATTAV
jgi:hypothetical protein